MVVCALSPVAHILGACRLVNVIKHIGFNFDLLQKYLPVGLSAIRGTTPVFDSLEVRGQIFECSPAGKFGVDKGSAAPSVQRYGTQETVNFLKLANIIGTLVSISCAILNKFGRLNGDSLLGSCFMVCLVV